MKVKVQITDLDLFKELFEGLKVLTSHIQAADYIDSEGNSLKSSDEYLRFEELLSNLIEKSHS